MSCQWCAVLISSATETIFSRGFPTASPISISLASILIQSSKLTGEIPRNEIQRTLTCTHIHCFLYAHIYTAIFPGHTSCVHQYGCVQRTIVDMMKFKTKSFLFPCKLKLHIHTYNPFTFLFCCFYYI